MKRLFRMGRNSLASLVIKVSSLLASLADFLLGGNDQDGEEKA